MYVKNLCNKKLTDLYLRTWKEDLFTMFTEFRKEKNYKNKLHAFRLFKNCFQFEPYIFG